MWDRLQPEWQACLALAWKSYCEGSRPIGAVVTNGRGSVISRGRSGSGSSPKPEDPQGLGGPLAHAELAALLALDYEVVEPRACEIYCLLEPCPLCIGAVCMAGVKVIHFAARDPWAGSVNLLQASPYMKWKSIRAIEPEDAMLETVVHMLHTAAEIRAAHSRLEDVLATWERYSPSAVALGRRLQQSDELCLLRREQAAASRMTDRLAQLASEWSMQ